MVAIIEHLIQGLKEARKQKKLSQQSLADSLDIPQSHLSKIEQGVVNIQLSSFVEIARALDLEVVLVPRKHITLVKAIVSTKDKAISGPAYTVDDENENE